MSNTGEKRKRLLTRMRVQRFRKHRRIADKTEENRQVGEQNTDRNEFIEVEDDVDGHYSSNRSSSSDDDNAEQVSVAGNGVNDEGNKEIGDHSIRDDLSDGGNTSAIDSSSSHAGDIGDGEDSDENDENLEDFDEILKLQQWALRNKITHASMDELLLILRERLLPNLPKTAKTFLKTTTAKYSIEKMCNDEDDCVGEFVYFGIATYLQRTVNVSVHNDNNKVELLIGIDGLPLYKSSSKQFWPILMKVHSESDIYKPFPIAVYLGDHKPENIEKYFESFVEEMSLLLREGIVIKDRRFEVQIKAFICDRPARSVIKCIKNHGAYSACERCTVHGERVDRRVVYPSSTENERTDQSFRDQDDPLHHSGISPLLQLPGVDMINTFVLDFMHLCCLGIMKKLILDIWLSSKSAKKISNASKRLLTENLISLRNQVPADFQRTTRSIAEVARWKATEFRFFLLYAGPIVLKNCLSDEMYKHFMLLHAACRILCSKDLAVECNEHAKLFLTSFVDTSRQLYGGKFQVLNVHSLIHLADDARKMQCSLSGITAFPFENALGKMKSILRSGNRPLAQLCRRLHEEFFINQEPPLVPQCVTVLSKKSQDGTGVTGIKKLRYKESIITTKSPNNTVLLRNGRILKIENIEMLQDDITINVSGKILKIEKSLFTYPCDSSALKMWQVKERSGAIVTHPLEAVVCKMVTLLINNDDREKAYTMPLLHM